MRWDDVTCCNESWSNDQSFLANCRVRRALKKKTERGSLIDWICFKKMRYCKRRKKRKLAGRYGFKNTSSSVLVSVVNVKVKTSQKHALLFCLNIIINQGSLYYQSKQGTIIGEIPKIGNLMTPANTTWSYDIFIFRQSKESNEIPIRETMNLDGLFDGAWKVRVAGSFGLVARYTHHEVVPNLQKGNGGGKGQSIVYLICKILSWTDLACKISHAQRQIDIWGLSVTTWVL